MGFKKVFLFDFVGGEAFLLEVEQYPTFWGYGPPLLENMIPNNLLLSL
jgi:hypothetical protein